MARAATLPVLNGEAGLSRYLAEIRRFPMLEPQEEYMLAKRWREHDDRDAAHRLVTSHLRLVAKIAMGYRGYGLPISVIRSWAIPFMARISRPRRSCSALSRGPPWQPLIAKRYMHTSWYWSTRAVGSFCTGNKACRRICFSSSAP